MTDGSVLVQDAFNLNQWWKLTPDINGSYVNGTWSQIASMPATYAPSVYASWMLMDGRFFVMGAEFNEGTSPDSDLGDVYDPTTNKWTDLHGPADWTEIGDNPSSLLANGKLFATDEFGTIDSTGTANGIWDPVANTWAVNNSNFKLDQNDEEQATLLPDRTLLVVDAWTPSKAEKFIPWLNKYVAAGTLPNDPQGSGEPGPVIGMYNGKALVLGGNGQTAIYTPPAVATDPGTWVAGPTMPNSAQNAALNMGDSGACMLPNGHVLGMATDFSTGLTMLDFDGTSFTLAPNPPNAANEFFFDQTALLPLPSGQVLFTDGSSDVEVYTPTGAPNNAWRPTITSVPTDITAGVDYSISGTQFNGLSQATAHGDDLTNCTNYPIVRITNNASGHVFYCRTHDHSTMAVATGSATVSTHFIAPLTLEDGASSIQVIANGIPVAVPTPITAHAVFLKNVTVAASKVIGGGSTTGTVNLNAPAPPSGMTVNLSSDNVAVSVPASVNIPWGATSVNFLVTTTANNTYTSITATITASRGGDPNQTVVETVLPSNNSSFVSQTVPTAMTAGQTYAVSFKFTNTSNLTWDTAHGYKVETANPYGNTTWGPSTFALTNGPIAPSGMGTFSGNVIAPVTAGTYNLQVRTYQQGVSVFGALSTNVVITVTKVADAAQFVSKTVPSTVYAGGDFSVSYVMKNVGTNTWSASGYSLRPIFNNWSVATIPVSGTVAPGAQTTFTKVVSAPISPGTYAIQWQMFKTTFFGDKSTYQTISVIIGPNDAQYISQTQVPTNVGPGRPFGVTMTMKNLGTALWDSTFALTPIGSNNFGVPSLPAGSTAQGATYGFAATFTAPTTPGTYTFQFRMLKGTAKFGQATQLVSIVVSADASEFISQSGVPTTIVHGTTFTPSITMTNTGSTTWDSTYNLASIGNYNFGVTSIPAASTAPGGSMVFSATFTAPTSPGTYTFQMQMQHGTTRFGEKATFVTITVT